MNLEQLGAAIPDVARDIRLNLQAVLQPGALTPSQRWGVAIAAAATARHRELREALIGAARSELGEAAAGPVIDDALAAAALMAMNNVYFRFRHLVHKPSYAEKPARLRMQRLVKPATGKADFELLALAVSALNGCESCIRGHERIVDEGAVTEDQVHDAVRIAAVIQAAAVALDLGRQGA